MPHSPKKGYGSGRRTQQIKQGFIKKFNLKKQLSPLCQTSKTKKGSSTSRKLGEKIELLEKHESFDVKHVLPLAADTTQPLTDTTLKNWSSTELAKSSPRCSGQCWLPSGKSSTGDRVGSGDRSTHKTQSFVHFTNFCIVFSSVSSWHSTPWMPHFLKWI